MHRKDAVVNLERDKVQKNLLAHHIEMIRGSASFVDAHTVQVQLPDGGTETLTADFIMIATGSRPYRPADIPFDDHFIFDSDTILAMDRIPKSMIVVGEIGRASCRERV